MRPIWPAHDQEVLSAGFLSIPSHSHVRLREFMLEEVVTVVDASGRQALQELVRRIGLGGVPVPSLVRALNPKLSDEDKRVSP